MISILLFLIAVFGLVALAIIFYKQTEGFATKQTDLEKVNSIITTLNESICPALNTLIDDYARDIEEGTEKEKQKKALEEIQQEAKGTLFPCPPPADALKIPADIGKRVQTTILYLEPKLASLSESLVSSLDCPKDLGEISASVNTENILSNLEKNKKEGFEAFNETMEPFASVSTTNTSTTTSKPSTTTTTIKPPELTELEKKQIYKTRADALALVLSDTSLTQKLANIKTYTKKLQTFKADSEAGRLSSNCSY